MPAEPMRDLVVQATLEDAFDGIIRLLGDALRFGTALRSLTVVTEVDGSAVARLALSVPAAIDASLLAARLARHPAVRDVDAQESDDPDSPPSSRGAGLRETLLDLSLAKAH